MQEFSPKSDLALRFRNYVVLLDRILRDVEEELRERRSIRNEWSEWHHNWKKVWLYPTPKIDGDLESVRERLSVKRRIL
ncbi:hypothetical protein CH373_13600 [Leptospira perolatii]|uniref:Uncharacterized protein n=1 Tax=Leptospira perolatii TaxID=2023191 RepID=A0A2M9ZKD4_9LEPT|nr:hypothetical protein [Leptospira perolatii]PJZ69316.1 hypothetical protein CH360_11165 [Leptospira perolatii]PJZ72451.1 hypothetical protein CH373_13600 [Leptospira perolatii]